MHWIETLLGISPDRGNGVTEAILVLGVALVIASGVAASTRLARGRRTKQVRPTDQGQPDR
jgi:hypothetical protein